MDQQFQTLFNPVFQQKFKQGNFHITLEQAAAFTLAQADVGGNILQIQMGGVMLRNIFQNLTNSFMVLVVRRSNRCSAVTVVIKQLPEFLQLGQNFHFVELRAGFVEGNNFANQIDCLQMPGLGTIKMNAGEGKILRDRIDVFLLDQAVVVAVDQPGIKGDGRVDTVLIFIHFSHMKCIGIAEYGLSLPDMEGLIIEVIEHFALFHQSQFDFRMPVPEERAGFISGKFFVADQLRKTVITVIFQFFLELVGDDLHKGLLWKKNSDSRIGSRMFYGAQSAVKAVVRRIFKILYTVWV